MHRQSLSSGGLHCCVSGGDLAVLLGEAQMSLSMVFSPWGGSVSYEKNALVLCLRSNMHCLRFGSRVREEDWGSCCLGCTLESPHLQTSPHSYWLLCQLYWELGSHQFRFLGDYASLLLPGWGVDCLAVGVKDVFSPDPILVHPSIMAWVFQGFCEGKLVCFSSVTPLALLRQLQFSICFPSFKNEWSKCQ